jgi:hypothetical protein
MLTERRFSWKNVDGRSTSSHASKKFRTRSRDKQGETAFGFWKMATAVIKPDGRTDGRTDRQTDRRMDGWID